MCKYACVSMCDSRVGQNHIYTYIRCVYGMFGRNFIICTVIYGVSTRFWPTLVVTSDLGSFFVLVLHKP